MNQMTSKRRCDNSSEKMVDNLKSDVLAIVSLLCYYCRTREVFRHILLSTQHAPERDAPPAKR